MTGITQIGFSQRIRLDWLEKTARLFLAGNTREEIETELQDFLQDKLSIGGRAERGAREKAITILLKIWVSVPGSLASFHKEGLEFLRKLPPEDHLAVHWGMTMAVYPFFANVAEQVGRLIRLQESFTLAQIQRRIREQLGERETVARAARRILSSFVDWEVLERSAKRGNYEGASPHPVKHRRLVVWLIESVLISNSSTSGSLKSIAQAPSLFPFRVNSVNTNDLKENERLESYRQGLDEDIIMLAQMDRQMVGRIKLK
jgi:hypothetical protein